MADEQVKNREELIADFKKENSELVEFLETTKSHGAYVVLNGKVAVTGVKSDEFKKWKEEKAAKQEEPKPEEKQTSEQPKSRDELIAEFEKENPELVEFLDATKSNSAYVVLNGKVAVTGVKADEFKKWKEEKAAEKKEEPKQEESKQEEKPEKTLGVDDSGKPEPSNENSDEWQKRYYEQHKSIADATGGKTSEAKYENGGVSFKIDNDSLTYNKPGSLTLAGETNLKALRAAVLNAKHEGISGIDFSKLKDEKNKERFYMLAVAYGMNVVGLDNAPQITDEKLAAMSKDEQKMFKDNLAKKNEQQSEQSEPEQEEKKPETKSEPEQEEKKPETKPEPEQEEKKPEFDSEKYKRLSLEERRKFVKEYAKNKQEKGQSIISKDNGQKEAFKVDSKYLKAVLDRKANNK